MLGTRHATSSARCRLSSHSRFALLAVAGLFACSKTPGGPDGGRSDAGASDAGASDAGASDAGASDAGLTVWTATLPAAAVAISDDVDAGRLWVITNGPLVDGGFDNGVYVLDDQTLATIAAVPLPSNLTVGGTTYTPFSPAHIIALPGLNKVYIGVDTGPGEVAAIDMTNYALTTVTQLQSNAQAVTAFAYDSATKQVYVLIAGGFQTPGYVDVIDATQDKLVATLQLPPAGDPTTTCAASSSTSCFEGQTDIAVDATGQSLYLAGYDQNFAPMFATFVLDGGTLQNVVGGRAADWIAAAKGIVTFESGGAMAGVWLSDGGGGLELLDPMLVPMGTPPDAIGQVESAGCRIGNLSVLSFTYSNKGPNVTVFSGLASANSLGAYGGAWDPLPQCAGRNVVGISGRMVPVGGGQSCLAFTVRCASDTGVVSVVNFQSSVYCCPPN